MYLLLWIATLEAVINWGPALLPPPILAIAIMGVTLPTPYMTQLTLQLRQGSQKPFWNTIALVLVMILVPWSAFRYIETLEPTFAALPVPWSATLTACILIVAPAGLYIPPLIQHNRQKN